MLQYFFATRCLYIEYLGSISTYPMRSFTAVANPDSKVRSRVRVMNAFLLCLPLPLLRIRRGGGLPAMSEMEIVSPSSPSAASGAVVVNVNTHNCLLTAKETNLKFLPDTFRQFKMKPPPSYCPCVYTHYANGGEIAHPLSRCAEISSRRSDKAYRLHLQACQFKGSKHWKMQALRSFETS